MGRAGYGFAKGLQKVLALRISSRLRSTQLRVLLGWYPEGSPKASHKGHVTSVRYMIYRTIVLLQGPCPTSKLAGTQQAQL